MPAPLSADQIDHFKAHGYLVVPGVLEPVYIQAWRRQLWEHLGGRENDPTTWGQTPYQLSGFSISPVELQLHSHPRVRAIIDQLGGGRFVGGSDSGAPLVHWPSRSTAWSPTTWGHLDGYYPGNWSPFMLTATAYAYDCEAMGGAFQYWPDSHLTTHLYFLENPEQVDGRFRDEPGFNWGGPNVFTRLAPRPPAHFNGRAGDVIFWHAYTVHTGSTNIRNTPRFAFFARYHHVEQKSFRYEIPQDLWKYWAV
ncbi:MAG: phytanoyl-CoA dioxygenase family protein [Planctomycetota bacterium]|nr:phytanoyl-CoA dioxygenase family protein [Planctomycetota bacterium]